MADIKQLKIGTSTYEFNGKYIQGTDGSAKTWKDITDLVTAAKLPLKVETSLPTASADTMGAIYLIKHEHTTGDTYDEYITLQDSTTKAYSWEKIGNTDVDLTDYYKKGETYTAAAQSNGAHTHTVTGSVSVPTVTATQKHLTASLSNTAIEADGTASVLTSVKATATDEVLGSGTTFKTPATNLTGATASVPTKIDTEKFSGGSLTGGAFTQGSAASLNMSVSDVGVLSIDFTPNTVSSFTAINFTPASLENGFYTAGTANTVGSIPAMDVTVGTEDKVNAVTGVGSNGTATALTGVKVKTQPTITLSDTATSGGVTFTSNVSTSTTTASITNGTATSAGAHTHDVKVASSEASE